MNNSIPVQISSPAPAPDSPVPDLEQTRQFINMLTGDAGAKVTFQTFDDSPGRRPSLARVLHGSLRKDSLALELFLLNRDGAGIFIMVNKGNLRGRKVANVKRVRAVFVDLDGAPLEPVRECAPKPRIIVESSPGRYHAYWPCPGLPVAQFKPVQRALATKFNGDPSVCDLPRVMRLPGFFHNKGEPFQTRIIE